MTHKGTSQTIQSSKRAQQAEIELLTLDYLSSGKQITELPSMQRTDYQPAFHYSGGKDYEDQD